MLLGSNSNYRTERGKEAHRCDAVKQLTSGLDGHLAAAMNKISSNNIPSNSLGGRARGVGVGERERVRE